MKRFLSLCIFAFFCILCSHSATLRPDTIAARMWRQLALMPQEKLYTQTDRSSYIPGDTIWVRHHIAEETTGTPALASRYVYVELIDPKGNVVSRSMMRQEPHGAIYGYVPTTVGMACGDYILRAYTRYMADTSPGYLFWRWIRLCDGGTHRTTVTLPKPTDSTPAIQIVQNASDITANIVCPDGFGKLEKNMWLIVSQRGAPVYARTIAERTVRFSRRMFSDGIVCFFLADNKMNIISERMAFVLNGKDVYVPDAPIYASPASRGMYRVDLLVPDNLEADCAVSITADNGNDYESTSDIVSTMLLTQELSGVVENPSWYFADRQRMAALDTLMQTQRWQRYDMQAVLKGNPTTTASYPEAGMQISGRVTAGKSARGVVGAKVRVVANQGGYTDTAVTDDEGRFMFSGFELPDSTAYMFAATDAKGNGGVTLRLDGHSFPELSDDTRLRLRHATADADTTALHGGKTVVLPELSVVAHTVPKTPYENLAKFGGRSIRSDELEQEKNKDIMSLLRSAGVGLTYDSSKEWLAYRRKPVLLVIDDTPWAYDTLMTARPMSAILSGMTARQVKQIDIVKGAAVGSLGMPGGDNYGALSDDQCAIVITTRRDDTPTAGRKHDNVATRRILGYQKKVVFDNATGSTGNTSRSIPSGRDMRRTVYWNPSMVMYGKTSFLFRPNGARRYRIIVEGISRQGRLIHIEKLMSLNN